MDRVVALGPTLGTNAKYGRNKKRPSSKATLIMPVIWVLFISKESGGIGDGSVLLATSKDIVKHHNVNIQSR